jgi:hypothetical protein
MCAAKGTQPALWLTPCTPLADLDCSNLDTPQSFVSEEEMRIWVVDDGDWEEVKAMVTEPGVQLQALMSAPAREALPFSPPDEVVRAREDSAYGAFFQDLQNPNLLMDVLEFNDEMQRPHMVVQEPQHDHGEPSNATHINYVALPGTLAAWNIVTGGGAHKIKQEEENWATEGAMIVHEEWVVNNRVSAISSEAAHQHRMGWISSPYEAPFVMDDQSEVDMGRVGSVYGVLTNGCNGAGALFYSVKQLLTTAECELLFDMPLSSDASGVLHNRLTTLRFLIDAKLNLR